jgi:hypothetical protein
MDLAGLDDYLAAAFHLGMRSGRSWQWELFVGVLAKKPKLSLDTRPMCSIYVHMTQEARHGLAHVD